MQLPRGTFREIKKNEPVEGILEELERTRFSGICSISHGASNGTLVFKAGICILVKFQGKSGDAGWDELQKISSQDVDAALSALDDAQVQLSLEFNKACRIIKAGKPAPAPATQKPAPPPQPDPVRKPPAPHHAAVAGPAIKSQQKPPAPQPAVRNPASTVIRPHIPEQKPPKPETSPPGKVAPPREPAPVKSSSHDEDPSGSGGSGPSSFDKDIDTFDAMDLENVTDKIRSDCKTMIKQLHLDHLMER